MSDFDKNIKIPEIKINTGKITAAVTKANEVMSDFLNNNPFSEFDRIANDIRDRVDNAIAMEFTKYIGELLRKNGVVPKITEYTRDFETDNTFETRYGVSIDELDFSEHDKVFEDKIAKLEKEVANYKQAFEDKCKDYKTTSELLGKYQQENESLKKRVVELENFSCQAEQETESLVEKLKQRIAELESKETESVNEMPDSITIDGYKCKIIKTESGLYISRDEIYSIIDKEKEPLKQKCKELEDKHQSDCIEINRLNTTIDVLIHKVEYLRQFAGLE